MAKPKLVKSGSGSTNALPSLVKDIGGGGGGGGTTDYNDLSNKPKINNVELRGNKTSSDLGLIDETKICDDIYDTSTMIGSAIDEVTTNKSETTLTEWDTNVFQPAMDKKQGKLTQGTGIRITNQNVIMVNESIATKTDLNSKQNKLTAGTNITIENDVISASGGSGGSYTAGEGIDITNDTISITSPTAKEVTLTQAQYDALTQEQKNNGTIYFISDASPSGLTAGIGIDITNNEISVDTNSGKLVNYGGTGNNGVRIQCSKSSNNFDFIADTDENNGYNGTAVSITSQAISVYKRKASDSSLELKATYSPNEDTGWAKNTTMDFIWQRKKNGVVYLLFTSAIPTNITPLQFQEVGSMPQGFIPSNQTDIIGFTSDLKTNLMFRFSIDGKVHIMVSDTPSNHNIRFNGSYLV